MPDVDADDARRGGRLLPKLFWAGVGLAPLAGLLLLVGSGGGLRLGGFLAVLSAVLIGLSIALRPDVSTVRLRLEETLLEEIDLLRSELREEIANSARVTHQTVGERLGAFQQMVESVRAERAAPPPAAARVTPPAAAPVPPSRGAASVPSAMPAFSAARAVPPPAAAPPSAPPGRYPAGAPVSGPAVRAANGRGRGSAGVPASAVAGAGRRGRAERRDAEEPRPPAAGRAAAPAGGVYRHTETVQVTRSTYVDEHPAGDDGYGPGWSTVVPRSRSPEAFEESWTDEKLRERYGSRPRPYERSDRGDDRAGQVAGDAVGADAWRGDEQWQPVSGVPVSRSRSRRWADQREAEADSSATHRPAGEPPEASAGGRWAAVRTDERGSELQVGERRASRHSYEDGTELRIEDRWAAVRRSAGLDGDADGYRGSRRGDDFGANEFGGDQGGPERGAPDYSRRALPATSSEPSWNDVWDEPVRQSRGHRYRAEADDDYRNGGSAHQRRQLDFELTDERWR